MAGGVINRRVLLGALVIGASGGAYFLTRPDSARATDVTLSAPEARQLVDEGKLILVDIRRPDEWARTGIAPGAHAIDMRRADFVQAVKQAASDTPDLPIAFICAAGVRSRRVTHALADAGLTNIVDIPEGMLGSSAGPGWVARGLPVVAVTQ
ncbi:MULTISPECIES: rhodanese-like domain-containing protein [unclassified Roseovarius]|uniref:rhodanese-like domain-containing protein n=1 Tax=unclassified Roseovarius TaxID=2614913 RepID=UPI00273D553C|nr:MULTISPECIES: rhodanese-like domain-containing protein [unclassified Roseovarius]